MTTVGVFAQDKNATPPSVSCLGPEGESYLRDLLAQIHDLQQELDGAKQALLTEREKQARRLQDKESEISDRAAALSERERSRAADLEAAKQQLDGAKQALLTAREKEARRLQDKESEISDRAAAVSECERSRAADREAAKQELERLRAASARGADAEQQLAALRTAIEEANEARRKAEEGIAAAQRAAAHESQAREETERRLGERERRERAAAESSRQAAEIGGKSPSPAPSQPAPPAADAVRQGERFLPGEHLALRVAKIDELNRTVEVADDGSIDLPLVGMIQAAGRTEAELIADLQERLTAYVREPRVEVSREHAEKRAAAREEPKQASAMDPNEERAPAPQGTYSVEGRVAHPGTYAVSARTTLTSAIAEAGGASFAARLDQVEIEHPSGGTEARHEIVNVSKLVATGGTDVPIRAGDVVRVPGSPLWALPWGIVRIVTFPFWYPFS